LPFDELLWLTREAMRVLAPGGMLMIETADVETMGTGFYDDPDHIRPLTVRNLQAILETLGFEDITMQHLPTDSFVCLSVKPLSGT
jgi:predicted SAM-dependent methyltransferase